MARYTEKEVDIVWIISRLVPGAQYAGLCTATYARLKETWKDTRPMPTWEEIEDEWDVYQAELRVKEAEAEEDERLLSLDVDTVFAGLTADQRGIIKSLQKHIKKLETR